MFAVVVYKNEFEYRDSDRLSPIARIVGGFADEEDALKWVTGNLADQHFQLMEVEHFDGDGH